MSTKSAPANEPHSTPERRRNIKAGSPAVTTVATGGLTHTVSKLNIRNTRKRALKNSLSRHKHQLQDSHHNKQPNISPNASVNTHTEYHLNWYLRGPWVYGSPGRPILRIHEHIRYQLRYTKTRIKYRGVLSLSRALSYLSVLLKHRPRGKLLMLTVLPHVSSLHNYD